MQGQKAEFLGYKLCLLRAVVSGRVFPHVAKHKKSGKAKNGTYTANYQL